MLFYFFVCFVVLQAYRLSVRKGTRPIAYDAVTTDVITCRVMYVKNTRTLCDYPSIYVDVTYIFFNNPTV